MQKIFFLLGVFAFAFLPFFTPLASAEMEYEKGNVLSVQKTPEKTIYTVENGQKKHIEIEENSDIFHIQSFEKGDTVLFSQEKTPDGTINILHDFYRLDGLFLVIVIFLVTVFVFTKGKGWGAATGLVFSMLFLFWVVIPQLSKGTPPLLVGVLGSMLISTVSMYLAHGFSHRTTLSIFSIWITLGMVMLCALFGSSILHLFGLGSEAASLLAMDNPTAFAAGVSF